MMNQVPENNSIRRRSLSLSLSKPSSSSSSSLNKSTALLCMIKNFTPSKMHTYFTASLILYILIITKDNFDATTINTEYNDNTIRNKSADFRVSSSSSSSSSSNSKSKYNNGNGNEKTPTSTTTSTTTTTTTKTTNNIRREPRLGDGCYNIFIDVGANVGVHGRFLFEPEMYPESLSSVQLFRDEYGIDSTRNNIDYCIFEIEANPKHWKQLDIISDAYKKYSNNRWKYHVIKAAVSDQNGNMTFYHQGHDDNQNNEWGFSNVHDYQKKNVSELGKKDTNIDYSSSSSSNDNIINTTYHSKEIVPAIRLSEWIQYHILERTIPKLPPSILSSISHSTTTTIKDTIIIKPPVLGMKMDIEGSEYIVLPDLIHSNTICQFNFVFGEFHSWFAPIESSKGHRVSLQSVKELMEYEWAITKIIESSRNCIVRWLKSDDESYLHDGIPLPT